MADGNERKTMLKIGNLYQTKSKKIYDHEPDFVIDMFDFPSYEHISFIFNNDIFVLLSISKECLHIQPSTLLKILQKNKIGFIYKKDLEEFCHAIDLEKK